MTTDWSPLQIELAKWRAAELRLPIWWRDDDAIQPTPELDHLDAVAQRTGVPVHLAVIPHYADHRLADRIADAPEFIPVVHGWAHQNHAPTGSKKSEFGSDRDGAATDAANGLTSLDRLFGARLAPMFVPPWNRIDPIIYPDLVSAGYTMLSTFTPRSTAHPVKRLSQINTHIDPIDWHGTRGLVDAALIIDKTVMLLQGRRNGVADNTEPLGLLTHHLVHTPEVWEFTEQLLDALQNGPTDLFRATAGIGAIG